MSSENEQQKVHRIQDELDLILIEIQRDAASRIELETPEIRIRPSILRKTSDILNRSIKNNHKRVRPDLIFAELRECLICSTNKSPDDYVDVFENNCSNHAQRQICNECLYTHTLHAVQDWNDAKTEIDCPEPNCRGKLNLNTITNILSAHETGHNAFQQFEQRLTSSSLSQIPDFIWCAHGCGSGQFYEGNNSANMKIICVECFREMCYKHRCPWHNELTCEEYDLTLNKTSQNAVSQQWISTNTKNCPRCRVPIQKANGCDHMTCKICQHQFCWECLGKYDGTSCNSENQHQLTCSHYRVRRPRPAHRPRLCTIL